MTQAGGADRTPRGPTFAPGGVRLSARDRILETARVLFYRRGVANVGVDEIIAESGVAKATLYKHFGSKDELILEYMRQGDARWVAWLQETVERLAPDPEARLLAVFDALREWFSLPHFRGCLLTNVVTALPDPGHAAGDILAGHKERVLGLLRRWAREAGAEHPDALAEQVLMLLEGATAVARAQRDPEAADRAQATVRALLEADRAP
ncbi:TetR family transcriptional regulator (plasmid) [Deinococcus aetherius]|uniref:TetR family transcriptional regulator n=1 Tax=Deinococcus aetherius TaxID=200252 RepID=A0ABM8AIJ8_9DEIO|nr:TetR/AcrR family transcriptional regulator [Deinococcus aetherius]BDP43629.1 TetR family transcriptional regulator [Deinococcus aetherius]